MDRGCRDKLAMKPAYAEATLLGRFDRRVNNGRKNISTNNRASAAGTLSQAQDKIPVKLSTKS